MISRNTVRMHVLYGNFLGYHYVMIYLHVVRRNSCTFTTHLTGSRDFHGARPGKKFTYDSLLVPLLRLLCMVTYLHFEFKSRAGRINSALSWYRLVLDLG